MPGGSRAPASAKLLLVDLIAEHDTGVAHPIRAEQWMTEQRTQTAEP